MKTGNTNGSFMSEINVTPFVDVMLVLLIIFMVTAPMMVEGLNVDLPEADAGQLPTQNEDPLIVSLDNAGKITILNYEVTVDFLGDKLKEVVKNRKDKTVYLKADKSIPYGSVVKVMAEIKKAGVFKLGMVTEPEDNEGS